LTIAVGAPPHRVDGLRDATGRRKDDDGQGGVAPLDPVEQLEPVHALHADVADHGIERFRLDELQRRGGVGYQLAAVAVDRKEASEREAHVVVVLHDQKAR
jgi:hypothetical protein